MLITAKRLSVAILLLGAFCACGCVKDTRCCESSYSHVSVGAFNDETFVWERYIITTNKVEKSNVK